MSEAHVANASRAGQYAQMLADSGDYTAVTLTGGDGRAWVIAPSGRVWTIYGIRLVLAHGFVQKPYFSTGLFLVVPVSAIFGPLEFA